MAGRELTKEEVTQRKKVYDQATTDAEAAQMLGISRTAFTLWRAKAGLKAKGRAGRKAKPQVTLASDAKLRRQGRLSCPACGHHVLSIDL